MTTMKNAGKRSENNMMNTQDLSKRKEMCKDYQSVRSIGNSAGIDKDFGNVFLLL